MTQLLIVFWVFLVIVIVYSNFKRFASSASARLWCIVSESSNPKAYRGP